MSDGKFNRNGDNSNNSSQLNAATQQLSQQQLSQQQQQTINLIPGLTNFPFFFHSKPSLSPTPVQPAIQQSNQCYTFLN